MDELLGGPLGTLRQAATTGRLPVRAELDDCRAVGVRAAERGLTVRALVEAALDALTNAPAGTGAGTAPGAGGAAVRATAGAPEGVAVSVAGSTRPVPLGALRRVLSALMEGYENAQRLALRHEETERRRFVDDLLQGRAERLAERAEHFGLSLAESYAVAVARPARSPRETAVPGNAGHAGSGRDGAAGGPENGRADRETTVLGRRIEEMMVGRFGSHNVLIAVKDGMLVCVTPGALAVAAGEFAHHVRQAFAPGWRIGQGRPHRGPGGVVTSYREAADAIGFGDRLGLRAPVLRAADLLVFPVLLRDRAAIEDLVVTVLNPLLSARGGAEPLLGTLEAVFASQGNQTAAARRLGVSTRAVTYRLERIRRLTGFSPDDPTQRFTLETAVLGARLLDWPAHPLP
ncbi:helix-turn-helix domain-containing protein [Streptosporangium sp. NPDC051022]|uniref:PucR family transcriptional regulator n=1 Tax=Streptosporangium sp. NPDC051022 TaxID=3155752 RepID=UPI0034293885